MIRGQSTTIPEAHARENVHRGQLLRVLLTVALLGYVIAAIDVTESLTALSKARPGMLSMMVGVAAAERLLAAWRWHILLNADRHVTGFSRVLRLVLASSFAGYAVPGSIGVEAARIYGAARTTADLGHAVSSVLVERLLAMIALFLLMAVGLILAADRLPPSFSRAGLIGFAALPLCSLLVMLPAAQRFALTLLPGHRLAPLREKLTRIFRALESYRLQPRLLFVSLLAAILFQLLRVTLTMIGAWALGAETAAAAFLFIVPAVVLLTLLPISIGGIGVQETGFVHFFGTLGMAPELALALSLLLHLMVLVSILPGAWLYWRRGVDL